MNRLKKIGIIWGSFLLNISLISCQQFMEKNYYKYDTGAFCANDYGMELYRGYFSTPEGKSAPIFDLNLGGPWGGKGGAYVVGTGMHPAPDSLSVGFYSEPEDKFYEGNFALPYERIKELLEQEPDNPRTKGKEFDNTQADRMLPYRKYDKLSISVIPGGKVYFWISGQMDQLLLGTYQAKEVQMDWRDFNEDWERKDYYQYFLDKQATPKVLKEIETHSLPYNLWDSYLEKFTWKIGVEGAVPVNFFHLKTISAEEEGIFPPLLGRDEFKSRAVPYWVRFFVQDESGKKYEARVYFTKDIKYYLRNYKAEHYNYYPDDLREEEAWKVFHQMGKNTPIELIFKIIPDSQDIKVYVRAPEKEIELKDIIVKLFLLDK